MKTKMKKYEDGGSTRKARLEGRATKKMGKAQRTYKEAEATLADAKSSGTKMDYADAEQLFNRSARQGERAKKLKAKAAMMKKGGSMKKMQKGGTPSYAKSQAKAEELYDRDPSVRTYTNEFTGKKIPTGPMTKKEYQNAAERAASTRAEAMGEGPTLKKKGGSVKKMKTGGMVNANTKVSALKVAGSKGVKSGVNTKATTTKKATGRSGGTSAAPKTAVPKAKYGMGITKMKKK